MFSVRSAQHAKRSTFACQGGGGWGKKGRHKDFDRFACTSSCICAGMWHVACGIETSLRKRLGTCLRCPEHEHPLRLLMSFWFFHNYFLTRMQQAASTCNQQLIRSSRAHRHTHTQTQTCAQGILNRLCSGPVLCTLKCLGYAWRSKQKSKKHVDKTPLWKSFCLRNSVAVFLQLNGNSVASHRARKYARYAGLPRIDNLNMYYNFLKCFDILKI